MLSAFEHEPNVSIPGWQLILNGLTVFSGVAGGASLFSGFSLEKKLGQITESMQKIEAAQQRLQRELGSHRALRERVMPELRRFVDKVDPREQAKTVELIAEYSRQARADLEEASSRLLHEALAEMRSVVAAVKLSQSAPGPLPGEFARKLFHDPFAAGLVEFSDISVGGLFGVRSPRIVNPHLAPVHWTDPRSRRTFLGTVSLAELQRYGIHLEPPQYRHSLDGHVYSEVHGLYVPEYFLTTS